MTAVENRRLIAAARKLLGWPQSQLAARASVGTSTVADYERGARKTTGEAVAAMIGACERGGIVFLEDGVRLVARPLPPTWYELHLDPNRNK